MDTGTQLSYSDERFAALSLVSSCIVSSVDAVLRRRDGNGIEPGVLASLLALHDNGYVETHLPPAGDQQRHRHWPVRLSSRGAILLARFRQEHITHSQAA